VIEKIISRFFVHIGDSWGSDNRPRWIIDRRKNVVDERNLVFLGS